MIHINLMPTKCPKDKNLTQLLKAEIGALKIIVFHLKNENKLQEELISSYKAYVKFLKCRLRNNSI